MTKTRAVKPIKEAKDLVPNQCSYLPIIKVQFFALKGKRAKSIHPTPCPLCMTEKGNPVWKGKKHYNMITFLEQSIYSKTNLETQHNKS